MDHLIDEQTGDPRDFRELPKVTWQARSPLLIVYFFFIHTTSPTLAEKLYKQENTTNMEWYGKYQSWGTNKKCYWRSEKG